jgi:hypothetical protein
MSWRMRKKLTPKYLNSLPPAQGKHYEVCDELIVGLHDSLSGGVNAP